MTGHPGGYDAAALTCPVHGTPMHYAPAERFDPLGDVACQDPTCTYQQDYDDAMSQLLATGRATLPDGTTISFGGAP